MATTGIVNATLFKIYVGGSAIACLTDAQISRSVEMRDTTCKDSGGVRTLLPGLLSWSGSGSGYFAEDAAYGFNDLETAADAKTALTVRFSSAVTGDTYQEGTMYITSLEKSGGFEDNAQFSVSFEGTSTITVGTVA